MRKLFCWQALTAMCFAVICADYNLVAQGAFQGGNTAYSNGSLRQSPPANGNAGNFEPSSNGIQAPTFKSERPSPFVQRTASRPVTRQGEFGSSSSFQTGIKSGNFSACTVEYVDEIDVPALEFGLFDVDGSTIANVSLDPLGSLLLTFEDPIMAFGADFAHLNNDIHRTEMLVAGVSFLPPIVPATEKRFYGFASDTPVYVIAFRGLAGTSGDGFGIDNVSYSEECGVHAAGTPEPSTLLGFSVLAIFAGGSRRRRA